MKDFDFDNEWKVAWSTFEDLMDLPLSDALEQLKKNEELNSEIKYKVQELLKNSQQHSTTFDGLADAFMLQGVPNSTDLSGQSVGPYHLLKLIGKGGMSSVYEAQRIESEVQKKVAVKIMHPYSVSEASMRMFDREQQALAQLDHPNIISFHHGGYTADGTPFLVTDYVDGAQLINEYVIEKQLSCRAIVLLFLKILDAIHYAHANLIIHRDLKPSNVLIDLNGHLKVVDFGIATLDAERKERTTMVFTPEYAAPEQLKAQSITTQADIFSLGAVLLKLLSGVKPLPEFKQRMLDESNDEKYVRGVLHKTNLDADLRNIILQAMQHDQKQRYLTVVDLRQDISNWLDDKPILATKDTFTYRLKKFVVRNKAISILWLATFISLIVGIITTVHQKNVAQYEAHKANEVKLFLLNALASNDPDVFAGETLSVRDLLSEAQAQLSQQSLDNAELHAELLQTIGLSLGKIGEYESAISQLEQAKLISDKPDKTEINIIGLLFEAKKYDQAVVRLNKLLAVIDSQLTHSYEIIRLRVEAMNFSGDFEQAEEIILNKFAQQGTDNLEDVQRVELNLMLANTYLNSGRNNEAEKLLINALDLSVEVNGEVNTKTIDIIHDLARFYEDQSENGIEKSLTFLQQAALLQERLYQSAHPKWITTLIRLANNYKALGQDDLAFEKAQKAKSMAFQLYGKRNIFAARADTTLSHLVLKSGDLIAAIELLEDAVSVYEDHYGADHYETNQYKTNLASYLLKAGEAKRSLDLLNELYIHQFEQLGSTHMATLYVQLNQIKALSMLEKHAHATSIGEKILPVCTEQLGEDHVITVGVTLALGVAYFENDEYEQAMIHLVKGEQSIMVRSNPSYHKGLLKQLIIASIETQDLDQAVVFYQQVDSLYLNDTSLINEEEKRAFEKLEQKIKAGEN